MPWVRTALALLIGVNLALIALNLALYPAFLAQPGALVYLLEPLALLSVYAVIALLTTRQTGPQAEIAVRAGLLVGLLTGCLWLVNHTLETFTDLGRVAGVLATAPFLLGAFLLWGVASAVVTWRALVPSRQDSSPPSGAR
jgi:hypothetical protein